MNPLRALQNNIKNYEKAIADDQYDPNYKLESDEVESEVHDIENIIKAFASKELNGRIITIEYSILENGLLFLQPVTRVGIDDDLQHQKIVKHSQFIAAKQSFIFIKSSFHTHKHHDAQEDRLTSIHQIDKKRPNQTANRLIGDLQRAIIEVKERECKSFESPQHYLQGFISYAKSLVESLLEANFIAEEEAIRKKVFFDNMLQSWRSVILKSDIERKQATRDKNNQSEAANEALQALSIFVAVFSIMFTGVSQTFNVNNIETIISGTFYEFLLPLFSNPLNSLNMFSGFGGVLLCILTLKVVLNPHGIVRRFSNYCWGKVNSQAMLKLLRSVISIIIIATFIIFLGWIVR